MYKFINLDLKCKCKLALNHYMQMNSHLDYKFIYNNLQHQLILLEKN